MKTIAHPGLAKSGFEQLCSVAWLNLYIRYDIQSSDG